MKIVQLTQTSVEVTTDLLEDAYEAAEKYTRQGYEVTKPASMDGGDTFTFTAEKSE